MTIRFRFFKFFKFIFSPSDIRLVGMDYPNQGRVEIYGDSRWGAICHDDSWDIDDADVVCRRLGYNGALQSHVYTDYGRSDGPTYLADVACNGG